MISKLQYATKFCQNVLKRVFSKRVSPVRKNELGTILKEIMNRNSCLHSPHSLLKAKLRNGNFLHIYTGHQNTIEIIEYDNNYQLVSFSSCAELQAVHLRTTELEVMNFIDAEVRQAFDVLVETGKFASPEVLYEFPSADLKLYKVTILNQLRSKLSGKESKSNSLEETDSCNQVMNNCLLPGFSLSLSPSGLSAICFQDYLTKSELDTWAENDVSAYETVSAHIDRLFTTLLEELKWKQRVKAVVVRHKQTIATLIEELADTPETHEVIKALLYLESMDDFALQEELQTCKTRQPSSVPVPRFG